MSAVGRPARPTVGATRGVAGAVARRAPGRPSRRLRAIRAAASGPDARRYPRPGRSAVLWMLPAAGAALALGGPVAAVVAGAYAGAGGAWWAAHTRDRARERAAQAARDGLAGVVADLRSGLPLRRALAESAPVPGTDGGEEAVDVARRLGAVCRLAERIGIPPADLLERLHADVVAAVRMRGAARAQAAGAQATAVLLAGLPVAGVLLGVWVGADPLGVLLHTPTGAACAVCAAALQMVGLAWAYRLVAAVGRS
jgi:tight adherence protein B